MVDALPPWNLPTFEMHERSFPPLCFSQSCSRREICRGQWNKERNRRSIACHRDLSPRAYHVSLLTVITWPRRPLRVFLSCRERARSRVFSRYAAWTKILEDGRIDRASRGSSERAARYTLRPCKNKFPQLARGTIFDTPTFRWCSKVQ